MNSLVLLWLLFVIRQLHSINIDDINLSNCTKDSPCEDFIENNDNEIPEKTDEREFPAFTNETAENDNVTTPQTTEKIPSTTISTTTTTMKDDIERELEFVVKNHSDHCTCDLKISSCDVNCCCDVDCNEFQLSVFSQCVNHRKKKYDSRYCYTKNFIQMNNTQFILERLANNLFCIAYDNLPPIDGTSDSTDLRDRESFERAKSSVEDPKFTWSWHDLVVPVEFNSSTRYHDKNDVWILRRNSLRFLELPEMGFTSRCSFRKVLKYLHTSSWMCMQTDLSNDNLYLFDDVYTNFTFISSPHTFNATHMASENQTCPKTVCLKMTSMYCADSWTNCSGTRPKDQFCKNGKCENIVKRVQYNIYHNGTNGIREVVCQFELGNTTSSFYQEFETNYEWYTGKNTEEKIYSRSGNPGYSTGNGIIIGALSSKKKNSEVTEGTIKVNKTNYHLTLPLARENGNCDERKRHKVIFGENVRSRCKISLEKRLESSATLECAVLQNKTLKAMLGDLKSEEKYEIWVSKNGNLGQFERAHWTQIIFDKMPRNVITGQLIDDKIRCSALVTSMHIEILYEILASQEKPENYKIRAVALNFSEEIDLTWKKCEAKNCLDNLRLDLTSYVSFRDISTSAVYFYAGGPNLDISLPYDFFYPFMSAANTLSVNFVIFFSISGYYFLRLL